MRSTLHEERPSTTDNVLLRVQFVSNPCVIQSRIIARGPLTSMHARNQVGPTFSITQICSELCADFPFYGTQYAGEVSSGRREVRAGMKVEGENHQRIVHDFLPDDTGIHRRVIYVDQRLILFGSRQCCRARCSCLLALSSERTPLA